MKLKLYIILTSAVTFSASQQYTTPVAILKQINKHNEDGSYSYGYEGADGSFKIETKYPNGEVFGKYGYVDDQGKVREVEYGASRRGFEPSGSEIQVPPPTLVSNKDASRPLGPNEEDDGQYREDPSAYYKDDAYYQPTQSRYQPAQPSYQPAQPSKPAPFRFSQSSFQEPSYQQQPVYQPQPQPQPRPQPAYTPQYRFAPAPQQNYYNPPQPAYPNYNQFQGHPAQNVDINTGSYSVNYRR